MIAKLLISQSPQKGLEKINQILADLKLTHSHPDLIYFSADAKLGIEEARLIKKHFELKPLLLKGKLVVIEDASKLTIEAQNSLLKTLEELPKDAQVILVAPSENDLLPTIISRCQSIYLTADGNKDQADFSEVKELISASLAKRFELAEKSKDRDGLIRQLTSYYRSLILKDPSSKAIKVYLDLLLEAHIWLKQNTNKRAVLEYLLLNLPPDQS